MSKEIFRDAFEQIWNNKDASRIERFIAPDFRGHDPADPEVIVGIEGYKRHFETLTTGFPDLRITIEDILEEARVVGRWSVEMTHAGDFGDIPPTGSAVKMTGISIALISGGQFVEEHTNSDALGLMRQIGGIPDPPRIPPLFF
jgi:predicted ester cyclase